MVQQLDPTVSVSSVVDPQPQLIGIPTQPPATAPYAMFVVFAIAGMVSACVTAFILSNDAVRGQWKAAPRSVISAIVCLVFLNAAIRKAGSLRVIGGIDPHVLLRRKKLIRRSMFFAALFLGIIVLVGAEIGTSGAETNRLLSDINQMSRLGDRISNARNAADRTVPAQVEMYKSIEPDVEQLSSVLTRLRDEYGIYDNKYPSQHDIVAKTLTGVEIGATRMSLLRQQIGIAKEIGDVNDADEQLRMWQTRMQPLLDRESDLDSAK